MILVNRDELMNLINMLMTQAMVSGALMGAFLGLGLASILNIFFLRKELHREHKQLLLVGWTLSGSAFFLAGYIAWNTWLTGQFSSWVECLFVAFFVFLAWRQFRRASQITPKRCCPAKDTPT